MSDQGLLDELLDPFVRCLDTESAQRLAAFQISSEIQNRVDVLAARANEGMLKEEERASYEALINAADFIAILKLKAQRNLGQDSTDC